MKELQNKIYMENEIIKVFNQLEKPFKEYFKQYENTKIFNKDKTLIKKIREDKKFIDLMNEKNYKVKPLNNGFVRLDLYLNNSYGHNLVLNIKFCFNGEEDKKYYCVYLEHSLYICKIQQDKYFKSNGIIIDFYENENLLNIDYEEQKKLLEQREDLKKEIDKLNNKIHYNLKHLKYNEYTKNFY